MGNRAYRGLERLAPRRQLGLDIKAPPVGISAFVPMRPLVNAERARAWLEVTSLGYLAWRAVA